MGEADALVVAPKPTRQLEREIAALRTEIGEAIEELDRRRQALMDLPRQFKKHGLPIALALAGAALAVAGATAYAVRARRNSRRPRAKLERVGRAARRFVEHPERVSPPEPSMNKRALMAAISALAGAGARELVRRLAQPRPERALELRVPRHGHI